MAIEYMISLLILIPVVAISAWKQWKVQAIVSVVFSLLIVVSATTGSWL